MCVDRGGGGGGAGSLHTEAASISSSQSWCAFDCPKPGSHDRPRPVKKPKQKPLPLLSALLEFFPPFKGSCIRHAHFYFRDLPSGFSYPIPNYRRNYKFEWCVISVPPSGLSQTKCRHVLATRDAFQFEFRLSQVGPPRNGWVSGLWQVPHILNCFSPPRADLCTFLFKIQNSTIH